ncbi:CoA transferase [Micrococcales bacterium 31B]|nr:CoA transferase [Micrococcales bacterium 31B]
MTPTAANPPVPADPATRRPGLPLDGIVVADFSRVLAGPIATMTLADLGARVIKVERPGVGDDTRQWGPPFTATATTYFESVNRSKESVTLDLRDPDDLALARTLALTADVLIENFKPGTLDRLGLGYDSLKGQNPGLVYASITGFGSAGGAALPGYDFVAQAVGGLMSISGDAASGPMKAGVALVDVLTGKDATVGILAALHARAATGKGTRLEVSLLTSLQAALVNQAQAYLGAGVTPRRMGNQHPSIAPYELLACAEGPLAVACGNDQQFAAMTRVLGAPELADDARFTRNPDRVANRPALISALEARLASDTSAAWQEALTAAGVPAGSVLSIPEGFDYAESLGLEPTVACGEGRQVRHPVRYGEDYVRPASPPPLLGEHDAQVRAWLRSLAAHE